MLPPKRICGVVLLLLISPLLSQGQTELLKNTGMEQRLSADNWQCSGCDATTTSDAHSGGQAFFGYNRKQAYNGPGQGLELWKVKPGKHYSFKSWVKIKPSSPLTQSQQLIATIRHSFQDGSKDEYQGLAIVPNVQSNKWIALNADFVLKNYNKALRELYLYVEGPQPGVNILLDDASLTELTTTRTWKTDAAARIEAIRKGDLTITLQSDKSLTGVEVKIEQQQHEFGFGTAVAADFIQSNANYRNWYLNNFEWAVLENAMKWRQTEKSKGQTTYGNADGAMKILKDNGKKVRGHAIFWAVTQFNPEWVKQIYNRDELYRTCMKRATDIVSRYKGRLEHWDVNNEMMAGSFFKDKYGSSNIRYDMFRKAREIDPNVKLFLNDYNVISGGSRLWTYINMAKEFQSANVPLYGIGVQGHFSARPQGPILLNRLDELAKLNLPIWVTELDYTVSDNQQRADGLEDAMTAFFSHASVEGVLLWGYYEGRHWKGADAALVNGPNMTPNAAGLMWQRLFHKQWRTNMVKKVDSVPAGGQTKVAARVFYGKYKITVSVNGKETASRYVTIQKSQGKASLRIPLTSTPIG